MYSKYAWSSTVSTCGGTRANQASSSARVLVVPVGLFGAAMKTTFVRSVTASSIASRSKRSSRSGTLHRHRADLERVEHVARERRPAGHDLVARVERREHREADDRVRAGADRDLLEADAVAPRERLTEPVRAAVRVAVQLERGTRDRLLRARERAVRALVRRELDDALEAQLALDLLDRLPRLVRDEPRERGADQRRIDAGQPTTHVAGIGSELAVTYSPTISPSPSPTPPVRSPPRRCGA